MAAKLTAAEIDEAINNNEWLLSCPDVELADAQRRFIADDLAELRAQRAAATGPLTLF